MKAPIPVDRRAERADYYIFRSCMGTLNERHRFWATHGLYRGQRIEIAPAPIVVHDQAGQWAGLHPGRAAPAP